MATSTSILTSDQPLFDDAIGPARYARVVASYLACLARKRPTYSVSVVQDADGKDVSYERLLLPFGSADKVEQIVGSYKAISIEGGFKLNNLMGLKSKATPVSVVNAVIDLDLARGPAGPPPRTTSSNSASARAQARGASCRIVLDRTEARDRTCRRMAKRRQCPICDIDTTQQFRVEGLLSAI